MLDLCSFLYTNGVFKNQNKTLKVKACKHNNSFTPLQADMTSPQSGPFFTIWSQMLVRSSLVYLLLLPQLTLMHQVQF